MTKKGKICFILPTQNYVIKIKSFWWIFSGNGIRQISMKCLQLSKHLYLYLQKYSPKSCAFSSFRKEASLTHIFTVHVFVKSMWACIFKQYKMIEPFFTGTEHGLEKSFPSFPLPLLLCCCWKIFRKCFPIAYSVYCYAFVVLFSGWDYNLRTAVFSFFNDKFFINTDDECFCFFHSLKLNQPTRVKFSQIYNFIFLYFFLWMK